jgi:hypothetical protein
MVVDPDAMIENEIADRMGWGTDISHNETDLLRVRPRGA